MAAPTPREQALNIMNGPAASSHDTSQHYDEDYHHQGRDESHHQIPLRRLGLGLRLLYRYLIFRQPVLHSGASVKPRGIAAGSPALDRSSKDSPFSSMLGDGAVYILSSLI